MEKFSGFGRAVSLYSEHSLRLCYQLTVEDINWRSQISWKSLSRPLFGFFLPLQPLVGSFLVFSSFSVWLVLGRRSIFQQRGSIVERKCLATEGQRNVNKSPKVLLRHERTTSPEPNANKSTTVGAKKKTWLELIFDDHARIAEQMECCAQSISGEIPGQVTNGRAKERIIITAVAMSISESPLNNHREHSPMALLTNKKSAKLFNLGTADD